jgi:hypothetical protein
MEQLDGYKLLLLPFAYAVSDAAAARVKEAAAKGAKVVLFGTLGETDEWGQLRKTPIFKDLVDSGRAVLISEDIMEVGGDDRFVNSILSLIDKTLADQHPFKMSRYGQRIDATLLAKNDRQKFFFLINWEDEPATVDLSVAVTDGSYTVRMRDEVQWHSVHLGGKNVFSKAMLKKFRRVIPAQKGEAYYICPAQP